MAKLAFCRRLSEKEFDMEMFASAAGLEVDPVPPFGGNLLFDHYGQRVSKVSDRELEVRFQDGTGRRIITSGTSPISFGAPYPHSTDLLAIAVIFRDGSKCFFEVASGKPAGNSYQPRGRDNFGRKLPKARISWFPTLFPQGVPRSMTVRHSSSFLETFEKI